MTMVTESGAAPSESTAAATDTEGATPDGLNVANAPEGQTSVATTNTSVSIPENWKESLSEDVRGSSSLGKFHTVEDLAKSYMNAERLIGKDKIVIPDKHATPDDWKTVFHKIGLPEDIKEYDVPMPEGADENFHNSFKEKAYELNMLPDQAKNLLEWYNGVAGEIVESREAETTAERENVMKELKKEWGQAYDKKAAQVTKVFEAYGDEQTANWLESSGLGDDPRMVKLFAKIGEALYGEDKLPGDATSAMTPAQAQDRLDSMYVQGHPLVEKDHPNHEAAVKESMKLQNIISDTSF